MKQFKKVCPVSSLQFSVFFVVIFTILLSYGLLNGSDDSVYSVSFTRWFNYKGIDFTDQCTQ